MVDSNALTGISDDADTMAGAAKRLARPAMNPRLDGIKIADMRRAAPFASEDGGTYTEMERGAIREGAARHGDLREV